LKSDYIDKFGNVTVEKNVRVEHGNLYRAILDNWTRIRKIPHFVEYEKSIARTIIDKNNFLANQGPYFSRNNMLGLYCQCKIHGMEKTLKLLPLMVWNDHKWYNPKNWNPNTWAVFLAFKYPIFKLNPLIYIMGLWSLLSTDYRNTFHKNVWFLTFTVLGIDWPLKMAQKRYSEKSILNGYKLFEYSHQYYFSGSLRYNNGDNPIREQVRLYYQHEREF